MDSGLTFAFRRAEYDLRLLGNRTEFLQNDYRLCAGGVILAEYLKSMDLAMDRIHYLKRQLAELETDMELFEQLL